MTFSKIFVQEKLTWNLSWDAETKRYAVRITPRCGFVRRAAQVQIEKSAVTSDTIVSHRVCKVHDPMSPRRYERSSRFSRRCVRFRFTFSMARKFRPPWRSLISSDV